MSSAEFCLSGVAGALGRDAGSSGSTMTDVLDVGCVEVEFRFGINQQPWCSAPIVSVLRPPVLDARASSAKIKYESSGILGSRSPSAYVIVLVLVA